MTTSAEATTIVTGTDAVYFLAQDFARARGFYETSLGLKATLEMPDGPDGMFVEYELGDGTTFGLAYLPGRPFHISGGIMFAVPDVNAAAERAKAAGGEVSSGVIELPSCDMAWVTDPEGNIFCLHRRK